MATGAKNTRWPFSRSVARGLAYRIWPSRRLSGHSPFHVVTLLMRCDFITDALRPLVCRFRGTVF